MSNTKYKTFSIGTEYTQVGLDREYTSVDFYIDQICPCGYKLTNSGTFREKQSLPLSADDIAIHKEIAYKYGVLHYFNDELIKKYINISLTNGEPNWFSWVCECLSNIELQNKTIGIIGESIELFINLLNNPNCCYLGLRRSKKQVFLCFLKKCCYGFDHLHRHIFDFDLHNVIDKNGYIANRFKFMNSILNEINKQFNQNPKITKIITNLNPITIRNIDI